MTLTRAMAKKKKKKNQTTTGAGAGADQFRSSSDTPITEEEIIEDNDAEIMEEEEEAVEDDDEEEEESEDDDDEEEVYVSMASTSKRVEQWQVSQPTRNWLELPPDLMVNILRRVGVIDILHNVQKVCTTWNKICKEPAMWRVIFLDYDSGIRERPFPWSIKAARKLCKNAIDRSQGQLIDITMVEFCDGEFLQYVADRSSQLRRLEIGFSNSIELSGIWTEALKKLSLLEELSVYKTEISREVVATLGCYCPMLKTLKLNGLESVVDDEMAIAIGGSLPELQHLELTWSHVSNIGLRAILDGCLHLESLDLRMCYLIDLKGELGKRCSEQIKCLQRPNDSIKEFRYGECVQYTTLEELLNPDF